METRRRRLYSGQSMKLPESREKPSLPQLLPTRQDSCLVYPQHPRYLCHICTCNRHRSLSRGRHLPNTRPLRTALSHLPWSFRATGFVGVVGRERWRGNVGWSYDGTQNHGSSGCRWATEEHLQLASGWAHHPTVIALLALKPRF